MPHDEEIIGSLWQKLGKYGRWYSGIIKIDGKEHNIVIFGNKNLKNEKSPTHRILLSKPREEKKEEPVQTELPTDDVPF